MSADPFRRLFFFSALGALVCVGCGGSGGPSGPPVNPATQSRGNTIGDAWTYSVSADLPGLGTGSGVLSEILTSDTYNGANSIRDTQTFNLKYPSGVTTISAYSEVSMVGKLEAVVSAGMLVPVTSDTFVGPSTFGPTTDVTGKLTLNDGLSQTTIYKVIGKERISVPAGTFDCWLIQEDQTQSDGTTDHFILDVAPETGNYVRAKARTVYAEGEVFSWQAELMSQTNAQPAEVAANPRVSLPLLSPPTPRH